jgi:SAM-dependent methyltransferase
MLELAHDLRLPATRSERARRNFAVGLRKFVLHDMAAGLRQVYERQVEPAGRRTGRALGSPEAVHAALRSHEYFRFYSALRVAAQDMVYQSVRASIDRHRHDLMHKAEALAQRQPLGSLTLRPGFSVPRSVTAVDIHLMPGSYHTEYEPQDLTAGAIYDNRLIVSSMGFMGRNLDDIGQSMAAFVRARFPEFTPRRILDLGCTVGHNTGAWKDAFPEAEVHGIDVAAPCLRYALARARSQLHELHFHQMNAEHLEFDVGSFDLVVSSMFLHEVPRAGIARVLREARRVLRPGGLTLHMELPPNRSLAPFDAFYLDWDGDYNNEPFYKPYRALDPRALLTHAGFAPATYFEVAIPSRDNVDETIWRERLAHSAAIESGRTGRLASGVNWYCFGAWKAREP